MIPLTDERLRQLAYDEYVCIDESGRAMAVELLAARARIAELERSVEGSSILLNSARIRIDALEAAQCPPLGYAVTVDGPGGRFVQAAPLLREADAVARARFYANQEARVVELREVQS